MSDRAIFERGSSPQPSWDVDFNHSTQMFDWSISDPDTEPLNVGGLKASEPLKTAIILCLFTDKRRPEGVAGGDGSFDRRGWHGDSFDIDESAGERELGSWLWTLERSYINPQTLKMAEYYAVDSLQTLVDQGLASRVDAVASVRNIEGTLILRIGVWGTENELLYTNAFEMGGAGQVTPLSSASALTSR